VSSDKVHNLDVELASISRWYSFLSGLAIPKKVCSHYFLNGFLNTKSYDKETERMLSLNICRLVE
jgi:hypothetical protein